MLKAAGKTEATYSLKELYKRSGSTQELRKFSYDLREFVTRTLAFPMPEYDLSLEEGKDGSMLRMRYRNEGDIPLSPLLAEL